jgi:glycerophosphoryl diester phosphodiesterase
VSPTGFRLYAHRGACLRCPENSLEAFGLALEDGANALEMDVHQTSDGHWVVAHDPDGSRVAGDARPIHSLPLESIKRWRLKGHARMPTLDEVLTAFRKTPMSIDIKPRNPSLVGTFLDILQRFGAEDRVTVASFHHSVMKEVHRLGWTGRTALSRLEVAWLRLLPEELSRRMIRGQSAQIPRSAGPLRLDRNTFIERCRRLGLRVDYWVINDPVIAKKLLQQGATGLMSDDPKGIAPVVAAHSQS